MRLSQREESLTKALKEYCPPELDRQYPSVMYFRELQVLLMIKLERGHDQTQIWLWAVDESAGYTTKIQIVTLQTQEVAYKIPLAFESSRTFRLYHNRQDYYALEIRDPHGKNSQNDLVFCLALAPKNLREKQIAAYKLSLGHFKVDRIKWHPHWNNYLLVLQGSCQLEIFNIHKNIKLPEMRLDLNQFYLQFLQRHPDLQNLPKKIQVIDFALPNTKFFEDLVNFSLILLSSSGLVFCLNPLLLQFSNFQDTHRQAYLRLAKNIELRDLDQDIVRQIVQNPNSPHICLRPNLQNYAHKLLAMRLMHKVNPKKPGHHHVKPNLKSQFDRITVLQDSKGLILIISKNSNQRGYSSVQVFYSLSSIMSGLAHLPSPKITITKIYSCKLHSDPPAELKLARDRHSPQIIMREKAKLFIRSFSHVYCLQIEPLLSFDGTLSIHSDSTILQKKPATLRLIVKADPKEKDCQQGYFMCLVFGFQVCLGRRAKSNQFFCLSTETEMNLDYLAQLIKDFNFLIEKQERKLKAQPKGMFAPAIKLDQPPESFYKSIEVLKEWQSKFTTVMGQLLSRLQFKFTKALELQKKYQQHKSNSTAVYNRLKVLYDSVREKAETIRTLQSKTKSRAVEGLSPEEIEECRDRVRILSMRFEQYRHLLKQINIERLCKDSQLQQVKAELQRVKAQMRHQ